MSKEISETTQTAIAKARMQVTSKQEGMKRLIEERQKRKQILENYLTTSNLSEEEKEELRNELNRKESNYLRLQRQQLKISDFQTIRIIGRGGFGEVRMVGKRNCDEIYALKIMRKKVMFERNQVEHLRAERDILAQTHFNNEWVVKMYHSFQDDDNLYLVMEYLGGGDMMNLLIKYDVFSEEIARFYIAELFLAIDSIHQLDYIHRDVKPDNILIGYDGHIKLTDFGLCTGFHRENRSETLRELIQQAQEERIKIELGCTTSTIKAHDYKHRSRDEVYSIVGTPDYTAPEVFYKTGYGKSVDYFSIGCILFEMICGYPPLYSEDALKTCLKIVNETENYIYPEYPFSEQVKDLISHLICPVEKRYSTLEEVKQHPFFNGFDWDNIENYEPPYIPSLSEAFNGSNFEEFEENEIVDK